MGVLILTASTGGGHNSAANAMQAYFEGQTDFEVETVDTLKAVGPLLDKTVCDSYLFMARRAPFVFGSLYKRTNRENRFSQLVPRLNAVFSHSLLCTIRQSEPDVIITTHPFSTQMVSSLKESGLISAALVCLITDYGLHKAWLAPKVDRYIIACADMSKSLIQAGVPTEKICAFGIPVFETFFERPDKRALRRQLGLDPDLPTVLFMAGSFGVTNIVSLYRDIISHGFPMQLIILPGKNQRLFATFQEELARESPVLTRLVYFTKEVHRYMHAADLLVTKPGGLTVSEALASNLPLVVFNAIPGQEEDNAAFLERHGMGVTIGKREGIADVVADLLGNPQKLERMRKNCRQFDKSDSSRNIAAVCQDLELGVKSACTVQL